MPPAPARLRPRIGSGTSKRAAAAAAKNATGRPSIPATRPHTMLPIVMDPKITVKNIESPRARNRFGKAEEADACRLVTTAEHEAPAITLAHIATTGECATPNKEVADHR
jgi:hypothetical protein